MDTDIRYLKGVGEKRAELYAKLKIFTVSDLLYHFPRDYLDLRNPVSIANAMIGDVCLIRAYLTGKSKEQRIRKGLSVFKLKIRDESGDMGITVFNMKYTVERLRPGELYSFYGRVGGNVLSKEMSSPLIFDSDTGYELLPIYAQTAGISSKLIRMNISQALQLLTAPAETLPEPILQRHKLYELSYALREIHFPQTMQGVRKARERFIFEELLCLSVALTLLSTGNELRRVKPMHPQNMDRFYKSLPYPPTRAQYRCIGEAISDMCGHVPMNRLIQGDVGSGKTLVVAACVYFAFRNGAQSALMVPTEILAEQHFSTLSGMLCVHGVHVALLTSSTKTAERNDLLRKLEHGKISLLIGTHALLSEGVRFQDLRLVVTDEQHRFGVAQRAKLSQKSSDSHIMVLSATPIPRTLSLMIYGDLSLSVIDELPPGRQPVETYVIHSDKRMRALRFIKKALDEGRQAYIVCPLIEQGETDTGLLPATDYAEHLTTHVLTDYEVGLLHGKMKAQQKEAVMREFQAGNIQVLVATTVIEVGVDVPNATIILIENAERFGLSQLHQLRGRVGRGKHKSYCILISDAGNPATRERLNIMKASNDGFVLAEQDLRLRGPGDFFGHRQHGLPELKIANLADDLQTLRLAQETAREILAIDPRLEQPGNRMLLASVQKLLASVGERTN